MKNSFVFISCFSIVAIIASYFVFSPLFQMEIQLKLSPVDHYPRWLKNNESNPSQTSGITLISEEKDRKEFLLADDIGKIHRLIITEDTVFSFSELKLSNVVNEYLTKFPKHDFEEIFYDKYTGEVYITIEGNGEKHLRFHGVYKLKFADQDVRKDTILAFEKIQFAPDKEFIKNLLPNIGYEGFSADENYFYLGLENIQTTEGEFSNYTVIRIADKNSLTLVKEISTDSINISTICGLYSDKNYSLWGIDRNHKKVFKLHFDEYFNVVDLDFFDVKIMIPGYDSMEYVGSLESITIDSEKFIFMVDDPWYTFFIPPDRILEKLDSNTVNNFKRFTPVIHKFVID